MKYILLFSMVFFFGFHSMLAQGYMTSEKYGRTLNFGLGIGGYSGYYNYLNRTLPVLQINYEIDVAKAFTLAPFISIYSYRNNYYWGRVKYPDRLYYYRETVIPMGVKGSYYFDKLVGAGPSWDFYVAGSLGVAITNTRWVDNYTGSRVYNHSSGPLYLDAHLGMEYHVSTEMGIFLDLSNGVSTFGVSIK